MNLTASTPLESGRAYTLDGFRPEDAPGVVELYRAIYGDQYPVAAVYDPQALIRQEATGEVWRVLARSADGAVIGQTAMYRSSPPNPELYELGQLMVRQDFRQTPVASELMAYLLRELPPRHGIEQLWGEAVCNHLFTQQFMTWDGFRATGLEVALMPGVADPGGAGDRERVSALLAFRCGDRRPQTLYVPPVYAAALGFIYEGADGGETLVAASAPLPADRASQAGLQLFATAGLARLSFDALGGDFEVRLAELESEASLAGALVTQVLFRLTEPSSAAAVAILRRRGYFLGGALPRWFGDDGLLLQKVRVPVDCARIAVYGQRARQLKQLVLQDRAAVQAETVGRVLRQAVRNSPDKTAVSFPQRQVSLTYGQLDADADRVARSLMALGVERGAHVAVWAANEPEYLPLEFGCGRAGAPLVMINTLFRAQELEYVLKQSDARILFLSDSPEALAALREIRDRLPELRHLVLLADAAPAAMLSWPAFLAQSAATPEARLAAREQELSGSDIFAIQYSSGTTGAPKGAMLSHQAYIASADAYRERQGHHSGDVHCLPLPFFHVYGNVLAFSALLAGAAVVVLERFRALDLLQAIETGRATIVSGTPTMFVAALEELSRRPWDLSSLRGGSMGGAFCPPELVRAVVERMGARGMGILYGSTEGLCSLMNAPASPLERRAGTVGRIIPGYEAKIIDPATGVEVGTGIPGELCVRGPIRMTRYYQMPAATAEAIDAEGWLHSGDLAQVDGAGYYQICGRIKDLVIRGGENIYPAEVEAVLLEHPAVLDAQVVGIPCPYFGEEVVACLRLKPGRSATVLELKRHCRQRLAIFKVPATCLFLEQFPLTASGKPQKFKLRELAAQLVGQEPG
jgi:fatty-acyl-CoA synthase